MIRVMKQGSLMCPVVECDVCHDCIGSVTEGKALFPWDIPNLGKHSVFYVHKWACEDKFRAKLGGRTFDSQPLDQHLKMLCSNTDYEVKTRSAS